jgi:hypothetical protein
MSWQETFNHYCAGYYTLISVIFVVWPFGIPSNVEILGCHLENALGSWD